MNLKMSHLMDRADVHSYFASMNPLASKIMDSLASVKHENESAWHQMEPEVKEDLFEAVLVPGGCRLVIDLAVVVNPGSILTQARTLTRDLYSLYSCTLCTLVLFVCSRRQESVLPSLDQR